MVCNTIARFARRQIGVSFLLSLFAVLPVSAIAEETPPPTISVTGNAEVRVVPDQVKLHFGIQSRAKALNDAAKENDKKVADVLEYLRSVDITERNIRTDSISIRPIFARRPSKAVSQSQTNAAPGDDPFGNESTDQSDSEERLLTPSGYSVERRLHVMSTDVGRFEQVYRGLVERGVNQVDSIEFGSSKLRQHRDDARLKAIRAAKEKAQALAGELGAKLAGVQTITEDYGGGFSGRQNVSSANPFGDSADGPDRIAAGEIEVQATVHVVFRLGMTEFE